MTWTSDPWLGFDTETTGTSPFKDRLVTAALVLRVEGHDDQVADRKSVV